MAPLTIAARALARSTATRRAIATTRCLSTTAVRPDASSSYESPFKGERTTTNVPDFSNYASKGSPTKNLAYQYFIVGGFGAITAMGAKSTIQGERDMGAELGEADGWCWMVMIRGRIWDWLAGWTW